MILSLQDAADLLGYGSIEDAPANKINIILPAVDEFIKSGTGHDWAADTNIDPTAKLLASALLVKWFDNPDRIGKADDIGTLSLIGQLHAKVLQTEAATV